MCLPCVYLFNSAFSDGEEVSEDNRVKGRPLEQTANEQKTFIPHATLVDFVEEVMLPVFGDEVDGHDLSFARTVVSTMLLVYRVRRLMGVLFFAVSFPVLQHSA